MRGSTFLAVVAVSVAILLAASLLKGTPNRVGLTGIKLRSDAHQRSDSNLVTPKFAASDEPGVLNVHIVPHTHDDVGWLKTVEQYYYGRNNTIQLAAVKYILTTVMEALVENPNRTFTYVEIKFFFMWWNEQTEASKQRVKDLIANGQLNFVNGGWCMHDEAATHYFGMIDQTTLGHTFLKRELGVIPTIGWQLDPFGHSATQASYMTAKFGFDALYFGRIDYQDLKFRQDTSECEGLWNSSPDLNETVFWGLTGSYRGNYGPPPSFCFDVNYCQDEPLVGDDDERLLERVTDFVMDLKEQSDQTKGSHIMLTMGSDFQYELAQMNFANYDLLVSSILKYQASGKIDIPSLFGSRFKKLSVFYSSPEYYTKFKHKETINGSANGCEEEDSVSVEWTTKRDDFFPYSDCPHCFWTGYFTSRTGFKRLERVGSSFLQAARQIECMADSENMVGLDGRHCKDPLFPLDDAMGVVQHHDAVSGTAKQHVAFDFAKRVQAGINRAAESVSRKIRNILFDKADAQKYLKDLSFCQLLNETKCDVSERSDGKDLYVVVYNGLAKQRSTIVSLPIPSSYSLSSDMRPIVQHEEMTVQGSAHLHGESAVLYFNTGPLPPLGGSVFRVSFLSENVDAGIRPFNGTSSSVARRAVWSRRHRSDVSIDFTGDTAEVSNGILSVQFDRSTGMIGHISNIKDDASLLIQHEVGYYTSFASKKGDHQLVDKTQQNSGAYIFRPSIPTQRPIPVKAAAGKASFIETDVGVIIEAQFEQPWVKQRAKVFVNQPYVEIEYTVGPIPIEDGIGKEVVTKICSPIKSEGTFYTDSNGREFLKRQRGYRPTWNLTEYEWVAGNYYPVNAAIYVEDDDSSLAVVVDRSQGGSSLANGCIEIMIQRRILADDARGVTEPMNETVGGVTPYPPYGKAERVGDGVIIKANHRVMVGKGNAGASLARSQMDEAFSEPLVFVGSSPKDATVPFKQHKFSILQSSLPDNVMLVTFSLLHEEPPTFFLIRLGHQYASNESKSLSKTAHVDMKKLLLPGWTIVSMTEKTLSGNQNLTEWTKRHLDWTGNAQSKEGETRESHDIDGYSVKLKPMEIRTFEVRVEIG